MKAPKEIKLLNLYIKRVLRPSYNEYLNSIPGKKTLKECFRLLYHLIKPYGVVYPDIVVVMTTHCSLKCAHCNNLMPCYSEPYHIDAKQIISDINILLSHTDICVKLELIGGEPFVYPHLAEVLDAVKDNPKVMCVALTTNGTVIPSKDILEKIASFKNKKVVISDYGLAPQKVDELMHILKKYKIHCHRARATVWSDSGDGKYRGKSKRQLAEEYSRCYSSRYCRTMLNGKVYLCARGAHLADLGYMDGSHDSFDIRRPMSDKVFRRKFRRFLMSTYADACNHCDHMKRIRIPAGEQL